MSITTEVISGSTAIVSLFSSYIAISSARKMKQYERTTERVAQYSNVADEQLQNTRKTETLGVLTSVTSLATASLFFLYSGLSPKYRILISMANVVGLLYATTSIKSFWGGKAKIPGMTTFNDAITLMQQLIPSLYILIGHWLVQAVVQVVIVGFL